MESLTSKQEKVLVYIRDAAEKRGVSPTLREICEFMGYSSIGSAQDVVAALRKKGFLQNHGAQKARNLLVTAEGAAYGRPDEDLRSDDHSLAIPCLGKVPAGHPMEAIEERVGVLRVGYSFVGGDRRLKGRKLYALQAEGESMIDAGILDGDWLVVRSQKEAERGDIVVARVDGDATVKRLDRDSDGWFLKPENPEFSPIYAKDLEFEIMGKVIALQRTLH